jgi:galactokinase
MAAGASGARLTGAGFGGCAIVLGVEAATLTDALHRRFAASGLPHPTAYSVVASEGAKRIG